MSPPVPPQVWLELAQTLGGGLEGATSAAFSQVRVGVFWVFFWGGGFGVSPPIQGCVSPPHVRHCPPQVLTVAATEPLNLLHSVPPRAVPPPHRDVGTPPRPPTFAVSIPRLYEHLELLNRGGTVPPLPPGGECGERGGRGSPGGVLTCVSPPPEAAVLLALLSALPRELGALDVPALREHLRGSWGVLSAPRAPPDPSPGNGDPPPRGWRGVGICPLNLFLLPLRLLERGGLEPAE